MSPDELALYVEALIGHFFVVGFGILSLIIVKDILSGFWKAHKIRKSLGLRQGHRVLLDGRTAIVSSISWSAVTFTIVNGGVSIRTVPIERVGALNIERVSVPHEELHKHDDV